MNSERNKALLRGLRHIASAHKETAKVAAAVGKPKVVISSSISLGITMEAIRVIQDQESEIADLKKQLNEKSAGQRGQQ